MAKCLSAGELKLALDHIPSDCTITLLIDGSQFELAHVQYFDKEKEVWLLPPDDAQWEDRDDIDEELEEEEWLGEHEPVAKVHGQSA